MTKLNFSEKTGLLLLVCTLMAIAAPAQTFTSLNNSGTIAPLIQGADGNFYGTTPSSGATNGTVFQMTPAGALTTLYTFCGAIDCTGGKIPRAALVQGADGNFYGTTSSGGTYYNYGTVFQMTPAGTLTVLHNFDGTDGSGPGAALVQATDGNFYGTTVIGGANNFGTVFRITPGGAFTSLYSFCATLPYCPDGQWPRRLIQATDGNLYGITGNGGSTGAGTVFKITPAGTLTTLYTFCSQTNCIDGSAPGGLVQGKDGNFYGTTGEGGAYYTNCSNLGCGTVFQMTPSGAMNTLYSFCAKSACPDGTSPVGLIQATDGNFYGTALQSKSNPNCTSRCGTVFEITPKGTLAILHTFDGTDGADPVATLVEANDGSFYGTTEYGSANYLSGTIFRLTVAPAVKLSTPLLGFGNQALSQTSTSRTVVLTNTGSAVLTIKDVALSGNFAISTNACGGAELTPLKNCKINLTFTPTMLGKQTGTLTFSDNSADSPQAIQLSGTGVEPATLLPGVANYGNQTVGTASAAKTVTLTNNQAIPLNNITVSTTGDFAVSANTCATTLSAKTKCTISVTFTPTATGKSTGQLIVSDDASISPLTSTLQGTGK